MCLATAKRLCEETQVQTAGSCSSGNVAVELPRHLASNLSSLSTPFFGVQLGGCRLKPDATPSSDSQ